VIEGSLVGRAPECERLTDLMAKASAGTAQSLLLVGEAGIGKTALLDWLATEALEFQILRTAGNSAESGMAYSALYDLLQPILHHLDELPAVQSMALAGALALAPVAGAPLAVGVATLGLLSAAAEDQPAMLLVDDLQWIDPASLRALTFAMRRLRAESIGVVATSRYDEEVVDQKAWMRKVTVHGLDDNAAATLLSGTGRQLSASAIRRVTRATGGNPLALKYAPAMLAELGNRRSLVPLPIEPLLQQAMWARMTRLPEECRLTMLLLALEPTGAAVSRAMQLTGIVPDTLLPAEDAGLVTIEAGRMALTHPLVHSAVYHSATPAERRAAHRILSAALEDTSEPFHDERRALHLAMAAVGPDAALADELSRAAAGARDRGQVSSAADLFERAAHLSTDLDQRCRNMLDAAEAFFATAQTKRAVRLLDETETQAADPSTRLKGRHLRATLAMWHGHPEDAYALVSASPEVHLPGDAPQIVSMISDVGISALMLGDLRTAIDCVDEARSHVNSLAAEETVPVRMLAAMVMAVQDETQSAREALEGCVGALRGHNRSVSAQWTMIAALTYYTLGELGLADTWFGWVVEQARRLGAPQLLPFPLAWQARISFRMGDWEQALSRAEEAVELARATQDETNLPGLELPDSLGSLALVEAGLGRVEAARDHADAVFAFDPTPQTRPIDAHAHLAIALVELGVPDYEAACVHLEAVRDFSEHACYPDGSVLSWSADLAEAAYRAGRKTVLAHALRTLEEQVDRTGNAQARAGLARVMAISQDAPGECDGLFGLAVDVYTELGCPFEQARTELCWGERLRRDGRPAQSRSHLTIAHEIFLKLGAQQWAARAVAEIRAAGGRPRRKGNERDALTAQELRVALAVADGLTNTDIAGRLFLSRKTVEYHLSNVFRKLNVQNRAALVRAIEQRAAPV
jgi:DNA-binding CsgD family transcriptional regulator/tetratricopeptide (TPR) repeat protein